MTRSECVAPAVHRVRSGTGLLGRAGAAAGGATAGGAATGARGPPPAPSPPGRPPGSGTTPSGCPAATRTAAVIAPGDDGEAEQGQHERGAEQILEFHDRRSPLNERPKGLPPR